MIAELRQMLRLAWPVIIAELGWITMGIVDTVMVAVMGPAAIGAVGTGSTLFFAVIVLGMGTIFALDTFVSQQFGANRIDECHRWLFAGLQLAAVMSVLLIATMLMGVSLLSRAGIQPEILALLQPYLRSLLWSVPPLLAYTVFRRYLQSMNVVRPIMIALVSANVVNGFGNWLLVTGHLGCPAFGVRGSAYATIAARVYLAVFLLGVILYRERTNPSGFHDVPLRFETARIRALLKMGIPAALQLVLEIGVFGAASMLAAQISATALAANQIVLNVVSFFFMIPLGLSSAAAVRVGQAVGRRDAEGVRRAGWAALGLAVVFGLAMSGAYAIAPGPFLGVFTRDAELLHVGAILLLVCAVFQPFDGLQVVATGALRGLGDTRTPMVLNLGLHWFVGLPLAYTLCFRTGWGVVGLWSGLGASLCLLGMALLFVWHRRRPRVLSTP